MNWSPARQVREDRQREDRNRCARAAHARHLARREEGLRSMQALADQIGRPVNGLRTRGDR